MLSRLEFTQETATVKSSQFSLRLPFGIVLCGQNRHKRNILIFTGFDNDFVSLLLYFAYRLNRRIKS